MFDNYKNVKPDYIPNNLQKCIPSTEIIVSPLEIRNAYDELIGYWWNYGDTIKLIFYTEGTVEEDDGNIISAEDFLIDKTFRICFYNPRYEIIHELEVRASTVCQIVIDSDISKNIFTRNVYGCSVTLQDINNSNITLFDGNVGTLQVK